MLPERHLEDTAVHSVTWHSIVHSTVILTSYCPHFSDIPEPTDHP